MQRSTISDERVYEIWLLCVEIYLQFGIKISFPECSDYKKTYQWRYAKAISTKIDEWELDDVATRKFIEIAVSYAKKHNFLKKGLSVLLQKNMLDVCYDELTKTHNNSLLSCSVLESAHSWFVRKTLELDPIKALLSRKDPDAFFNIVVWYQGNKLPPLYLSLSRICSKALSRLSKMDEHERKLLPSSIDLYKIREEFLADFNNKSKSKSILKSDWRC